MKKSFLLFFIIFLIAFNSILILAMPPHPTYLDNATKNGTKSQIDTILKTQAQKGMNRAQKAMPTTGNVNVLVILVQFPDLKFDDDTTFAKSPFSKSKHDNSENSSQKVILIILLSILSIFSFIIFKTFPKKTRANLNFSRLLFFYLCFFSIFFLYGCPNPVDINYTSNPKTNFYKNLLQDSEYSMKQYYLDMSNEQLNLNFDIVGPFTVSENYKYYGENDDVNLSDSHPASLVAEAVNLANNFAKIDFSKYDNDGDGAVDSILVVHAGPGEETGFGPDYIWSHQWNLLAANILNNDGPGYVYLDNKLILFYTLQPEYVLNPGDSSIGVFAHEFAHTLGLPDLYDTTYETDGLGDFSLMASGSWLGQNGIGERPAPLTSWEREYLKWNSPHIVNAGSTLDNFKLYPILGSSENYIKVVLNPVAANEQYQNLIVEFLSKTASPWLEFLPIPANGGVLIYRVDETIFKSAEGNAEPDGYGPNDGTSYHHAVEIVEADNGWQLWLPYPDEDFGTSDDFFSVIGIILSDLTNPNSKYYPGDGEYNHSPTLSSNVTIEILTISTNDNCTIKIY